MTITIKADLTAFNELARRYPKQANRAMEKALDKTAYAIRDGLKAVLPVVFDRPTRWTMNAFQVTPTQNHNGIASVWFKDPAAGRHYLLPEVEGGKRKLKGFERALGGQYFQPGRGAALDAYGNLSSGKIRQILSVLGRAEQTAGYMANKTARSEKLNRAPRDYVRLKLGNRGGLPPGVYERFKTGVGFSAKTKKTMPFGVYQKGRTRGRFTSVVRAKGLKAILIETRSPNYAVRLPFGKIGQAVVDRALRNTFLANYAQIIGVGK